MLSPIERARLSLEGLSLGDAFGERFFEHPHTVDALIDQRALPGSPVWHSTPQRSCAIVGEIVAPRVGHEGLPRAWLERREPLPAPIDRARATPP